MLRYRNFQEAMMNLMPAYEKWEAETIAEGEKRKSLQIAQRMLKKKTAIAEIAELTGLTIEPIQALQV
jgi:predicted transposase/invertase (TIGR01784 family)